MEFEILTQASGGQEFVQGLLLIALIVPSTESKEATRINESGWGVSNRATEVAKKRTQCKQASLGQTRSPRCAQPHLPYSSRIILSTLRTMLPTVVSEG